ncbi:unnamed protein product [Rotaria sp. Silwood1]|nr:unnamed protein product [Rotaria sp. Silwood1]
MTTDSNIESFFSEPWLIGFVQDDSQEPYDLVNNVTKQMATTELNEQNVSAKPKDFCSWSEHERLTGEILNQAAKRVAAETFKTICIYHPTQNHTPSQDGPNIRPDYIIAWSYNGVRKNTAIVDAKDHQGNIPRKEYDKVLRDMRATKATRGILVLGENATISDKLRADIEKDNKVDIVQIQNDRNSVVRAVTQHIGKIINKDFVPDDKRWDTYRSNVSSTEKSKEMRANPHGENQKYTCTSTYHQFNYPRKQDGTIDERYEANRDRNKDGGPDMRMVHNKSKETQKQHLNVDGSEDMRSKEHREDLIDETGHHLNVDRSRDMRCKENQTETSTNISSVSNNDQTNENIDMRQKENREDLVDNTGHHLNVDRSPDMRCNENKTDVPSNMSANNNDSQSTKNVDMRQKENRQDMVDDEGDHLNVDGSLDMRFKENQEEVNGSPSNEPQLSTNQTEQEGSGKTDTSIPTKNDGTADMRYTTSKEAVASGVIEPNEQLTEGGEAVPTGDNGGFSAGSTLSDIQTKSDGTADMRFSASQDAVASGEISGDQVLGDSSGCSIGGTVESLSGK